MALFARIAAVAAILFVIPSSLYAAEHYSVQTGSLGNKARAQKMLSRLLGSGFDCSSERQGDQYKVICGNFNNLSDVKAFRQKLRSKGYADAFAVKVTRGSGTSTISEDIALANGMSDNGNGSVNSNTNRNSYLDEYYSVQVGTLVDDSRSRKLLGSLSGGGFNCVSVPVGFKYSVICGKLGSVAEARVLREQLKSKGFEGAFAVHVLNGGIIKDISGGVDPEDKLTGALAVVGEGLEEYYSVQVGSLGNRRRAEKMVSRLWSGDLECAPIGIGGKFKVLCGRFDTSSRARLLKQRLISMGYADAFTVRVSGHGGPEDEFANINKNLNVSVEPEQVPQQKVQPLVKKPDIWGRDGGHVHPFASVSSIYTDNLYSSNERKRPAEEDTVIITSAGLWLSMPSIKKPIGSISTVGHVPGGFRGLEILPLHEGKRLAFLSYRTEKRNFSEHDYEDGTSHYARAYLGYRSPKGHKIVLNDMYHVTHSFIGNAVTGTGFVNSPGDYSSNSLSVLGTIKIASKASVDIEHVFYELDYKAPAKALWNRDDSMDRIELFFNISPKTRMSLGYVSRSIDYVKDIKFDRKEKEYFLGLHRDMSGKIFGLLRIGVSKSEYEGVQPNRSEDLNTYMGRVQYRMSPKTTISGKLSRSSSESDDIGSDNFTIETMGLSAKWSITPKIMARMGIDRSVNSYYSVILNNLNREDTRLMGHFILAYALNRNMAFECGTTYHSRTSSVGIYDFDTWNQYAGFAVSF
jgi:cell division septation protein DedD